MRDMSINEERHTPDNGAVTTDGDPGPTIRNDHDGLRYRSPGVKWI